MKTRRFHMPDNMRSAALILVNPPPPQPKVMDEHPRNILGPIPPEGHKLAIVNDGRHAERTEALLLRTPHEVRTREWTKELKPSADPLSVPGPRFWLPRWMRNFLKFSR